MAVRVPLTRYRAPGSSLLEPAAPLGGKGPPKLFFDCVAEIGYLISPIELKG